MFGCAFVLLLNFYCSRNYKFYKLFALLFNINLYEICLSCMSCIRRLIWFFFLIFWYWPMIRILSRAFFIRILVEKMSRFFLSSYLLVIFKYARTCLRKCIFCFSQTFIELSFMEAVRGCNKTITFQTEVLCNTCGMLMT